MVGGQDFGFAGGVVGIAAFVFTAGLAAAFAAVALAVVLVSELVSEADQVGAAAVVAGDSLSKHEHSLPNNLIWDTTLNLKYRNSSTTSVSSNSEKKKVYLHPNKAFTWYLRATPVLAKQQSPALFRRFTRVWVFSRKANLLKRTGPD